MRLERLVAAGILFMGSQAQAMLIESGSFIDEVERLKNLSFVSGSNLYVAPDLAQRSAFRSLANSIASGDTVSADAQAAALDYEVVEFTDSNTGNTYLGLREQLVNDQQTRGWGSYFFNTGADVQVLIEAPHPRFDTNSWEIAASIYRDVNAAGFLMAGAHRNANGVGTADVAHLTESIFQEVHEAWTGAGERDAWQIHGFNLDNHPIMPADTDAVVTAGDGSVSSGMLAVDAFLEAAGLVTYGYNTLDVNDVLNQAINGSVDGQDFAGLGATTNVQGDYTRSLGADFVHIEMEQSIRFDTNNRIAAAGAVVAAINSVEMPIPEPATLLLMLSATIPLTATSHMKKLLSSLILIAAILWVAYPYAQIYRLDQALQANDKATLAALIDIATVKEDQRTRIEQRANSAIGQGDDPISSMLRAGAKRLGESAVDTVVDVDWVRGQLAGAEARKGQFPPLVGRIDYAFFDNWNRFMVRVGELGRNPLHFRLGFADWQWRVVAIYPG